MRHHTVYETRNCTEIKMVINFCILSEIGKNNTCTLKHLEVLVLTNNNNIYSIVCDYKYHVEHGC